MFCTIKKRWTELNKHYPYFDMISIDPKPNQFIDPENLTMTETNPENLTMTKTNPPNPITTTNTTQNQTYQ